VSAGSDEARSFEPWAWLAFVLTGAQVVLLAVLGSRPGAPLGPLLYTTGSIALGLASVLLLAVGLAWSVSHRPVLGRKRLLPLLLLAGCVVLSSLPLPYPSSHARGWSTVAFRLPFDGAWRVVWGGERRSQNVLVLSPARRYGFELEPLPETLAGNGADAGPDLLSPADGRVVSVVPGASESPFGNHLVLEVAEGEFLVLGNLLHEGVAVEPGDTVRSGQRIGALSLGGSRLGGRLSVHLQDSPVPGEGEGIPMRFRDYETGGRAVAAGVPTGGFQRGLAMGEVIRPGAPR
jgi:hypothetical protein